MTTIHVRRVIQSPLGNGILVATGKLGFDAGPSAGFDVCSRVANGVTVANTAFATLAVEGKYSFYRVSLTTGRALLIGGFDDPVFDIAVPAQSKQGHGGTGPSAMRSYLGNGASFCVALAGVGDRATFITMARNV